MQVLLIGSGGREHAIAASLSRSAQLSKLFVAPGNPGCAAFGELIGIDVADHEEVVRFCRANRVGLVVCGPEGPLVAGIADAVTGAGILCFGPSKAAAQLEGSKAFTKQFCDEFHIPTAGYRQFDQVEGALDYVRRHGAPIVVKADGLAAGKGVVVAETVEEAAAAVIDCFDGKFGSAGAHVVLEEKLCGQEISYFALCDGLSAVPFGIAQDHKRVGDGDTGPNTGGMGAFSPVPFVSAALSQQIFYEIISPTLAGMRSRGTPFRGVLFAGLMIGNSGPMLIEFNVRFGDPEAQVLLERAQGDMLELFIACAKGELGSLKAEFSQDTAVGVVMASKGYPGVVEKGSKIAGLNSDGVRNNARVFQGATRGEGEDIYADGGRVLTVVGAAPDLITARRRAYAAVQAIDWPGAIYRSDIASRSVSPARAIPQSPRVGKRSN